MDIGVSQDNQQTGVLLHTLFSRHPTAKETVSPKERENKIVYESIATVGEIRVYWRADFQSGSRVLKKVF